MKRTFQRVVGETIIHVIRDDVWFRPWRVVVKSGNGVGHKSFWTKSAALSLAEWLLLVVGDALEAVESEQVNDMRTL